MTVKIGDTTYIWGGNNEHGKRFWKAALMNLVKENYIDTELFDYWWQLLIEKTE